VTVSVAVGAVVQTGPLAPQSKLTLGVQLVEADVVDDPVNVQEQEVIELSPDELDANPTVWDAAVPAVCEKLAVGALVVVVFVNVRVLSAGHPVAVLIRMIVTSEQ
jgi:hypothetical protein